MQRVTAYLSLGSNLGDRAANIGLALERLADSRSHITKVSSFLENPAIGMPTGSPAFLNGAAEIVTEFSAEQLLAHFLRVEQSLGRTRSQSWTPRTIDLDLLLYGSQVIEGDELIVPHPRMHERYFVLQPLAEIAPDFVHPKLQLTIDELRTRIAANLILR